MAVDDALDYSATMRRDIPEATALRRFALFADLDPVALEMVRRRMRMRVAGAGQEILAQDVQDAREVYFLISGRVQIEVVSPTGAPVRLAEIGPGEVFGDLAAIDGAERSAAVIAAKVCRLAVMSAAAFLDTVTTSPDLALRMMRILSTRLRQQNTKLFEKSALDLPERVWTELLRRTALDNGFERIAPAPGPTEIARAIGARRETVSREITRLIRIGALRREPGALVVDRSAHAAAASRVRSASCDADFAPRRQHPAKI